jgi:hypothetical protein
MVGCLLYEPGVRASGSRSGGRLDKTIRKADANGCWSADAA